MTNGHDDQPCGERLPGSSTSVHAEVPHPRRFIYGRRMSAMRRCLGLAGALLLVAAACGSNTQSADSLAPNEASTTTFAYDPASEQVADKSALPPLEDPARFDRGRTRIGAIEGLEVTVAEEWALASGWREVLVVDIDNPEVEDRPADYWPFTLGLHHRDGIVVEAWVGG